MTAPVPANPDVLARVEHAMTTTDNHDVFGTLDDAIIRAEVDATDPGFNADSRDHATVLRVMRRRFILSSERTRLKDQMEAMLADYDRKLAGIDYVYGAFLSKWTQDNLRGKARSVKIQWGTLGFRKRGEAIVIEDEAKLREAVNQEPPDSPLKKVLETPEPVVRKSALNEYYALTGAVPPGCVVKDAEDKFYMD